MLVQLSVSSPFMAGVVDGALEHRVLVVQLAIGYKLRRRTPPCCRNQFIRKSTALQFGGEIQKAGSVKIPRMFLWKKGKLWVFCSRSFHEEA